LCVRTGVTYLHAEDGVERDYDQGGAPRQKYVPEAPQHHVQGAANRGRLRDEQEGAKKAGEAPHGQLGAVEKDPVQSAGHRDDDEDQHPLFIPEMPQAVDIEAHGNVQCVEANNEALEGHARRVVIAAIRGIAIEPHRCLIHRQQHVRRDEDPDQEVVNVGHMEAADALETPYPRCGQHDLAPVQRVQYEARRHVQPLVRAWYALVLRIQQHIADVPPRA
jgi:hypothetical protein